MFHIAGIIQTLSMLNIADPGEARVDMNGRFVSKEEGGFPCIRTRHAMLPNNFDPGAPMEALDDLAVEGAAATPDAGDKPGRARHDLSYAPVIPANALRGMLRRAAAEQIFEALLERKERLTLDAYNVMRCGAATGSPDSAPPALAEVQAAAAHPYFGLFGGGPRLFASKLMVDDGLAVAPATLPFLPESAAEFVSTGRLTQIFFKRRNDDVAQFANVEMQQAIVADHDAAVNAYQDKAARQRGKDEDAGRGVRSFHALEGVRRGVNFAMGFRVDAGDAHLGLFLVALRAVMAHQRIGGLGQIGFGRFAVLKFVVTDSVTGETGPIFKIVSDSNEIVHYDFNDEHPVVARALDAWAAARDMIDAAAIESFSLSNDKQKDAGDDADEMAGKTRKRR